MNNNKHRNVNKEYGTYKNNHWWSRICRKVKERSPLGKNRLPWVRLNLKSMDPLKDPPETQRRPHLKVRLKLNKGPVETSVWNSMKAPFKGPSETQRRTSRNSRRTKAQSKRPSETQRKPRKRIRLKLNEGPAETSVWNSTKAPFETQPWGRRRIRLKLRKNRGESDVWLP